MSELEKIFDVMVSAFTLAHLPIGNVNAKGVVTFKAGCKGDIITYIGDWGYFKKK